jgi:HSP20 family molecular chaperone IbpA
LEGNHRNEWPAGRFVRSIELPEEFDSDKIAAELKHGVLALRFLKKKKAKSRKVEISVS